MNQTLKSLVVVIAGSVTVSWSAGAGSATAFELVKKGDQYVGTEAKGRVISIRSDKSIGTLTPNIWHIRYFDPNSSGKATEVKFEAGEKTEVTYKSGFLGLQKKPEALPADQLKVDSDKALETATSEPLLKSLTLKATSLTLEAWQGMAVWKVRIWAAKLQKPEEMVDIGEVYIGAQEGKVLRSDLKIKRVD